jgi:hypothetical protein
MDEATKRIVRERAKDTCEYCRLPESWSESFKLQIEHIVARQHHGGDTLDNLGLACIDCNLHKGPNIAGIDPLSLRLTELFHPRRHLWTDHFEERNGLIVGKTGIGRTTVDVLDLNAEDRIKLRVIIAEQESS